MIIIYRLNLGLRFFWLVHCVCWKRSGPEVSHSMWCWCFYVLENINWWRLARIECWSNIILKSCFMYYNRLLSFIRKLSRMNSSTLHYCSIINTITFIFFFLIFATKEYDNIFKRCPFVRLYTVLVFIEYPDNFLLCHNLGMA